MNRFLNKVFCGNALDLLRLLPTGSVNSVIADAMYGTSKNCRYDWGLDPARGDPVKHWQYHEPIYHECLRVLRPGGVLAWAQGVKFCKYFEEWFGPHRLWTLTRFRLKGQNTSGHAWIVQTREQRPIPFPNTDALVTHESLAGELTRLHPCIKPPEEMVFLVEHLTKPGEIVLDCFSGLGATLIAAERLGRRWIGCDLSRLYCQKTMQRLAEEKVRLCD